MQVLKRRKNYTDYRKNATKNTRKIQVDVNFQDHTGSWFETLPQLVSQGQAPPEWAGAYDFDRASLNAPLQFFARDAQDAGNRAMVGFRLANSPSCWVNFKAHNIDSAVDVTDVDDLTVEWVGLWTDTTYRVKHIKRGIKTDFVLTGENHPASFTETVQMGAGMTLQDNGDNTISIMKAGESLITLPAPYGYVESDAWQKSVIRATMVVGEKINGRDSIVITPNADDLASVGYAENIVIDPTATISGTSEIEDLLIYDGSDHSNYGNLTSHGPICVGDSNAAIQTGRSLTRILNPSTNIPAGTLTEARLLVYRRNDVHSVNSGTIQAYAVADTYDNWVEGTGTGSTQAGSADWVHREHATSSWSSPGLAVGTDTDASNMGTLAYSGYEAGADVLTTFTFSTTVPFSDWRDGNRDNGGIFFKEASDASADRDYFLVRSTENGSNEPYFEIDYTTLSASRRTVNTL